MSVEVESIAAKQARAVAEELLRIAKRGGTEADTGARAANFKQHIARPGSSVGRAADF